MERAPKRSRKKEVALPTEKGYLPLLGNPGAATPQEFSNNLTAYWQAMEGKHPDKTQKQPSRMSRIGRRIAQEAYGAYGMVMGGGLGLLIAGVATGALSSENPGPLIGVVVGGALGSLFCREMVAANFQAEQTNPGRTSVQQPTRRG